MTGMDPVALGLEVTIVVLLAIEVLFGSIQFYWAWQTRQEKVAKRQHKYHKMHNRDDVNADKLYA
jgi:hypothetical protein